MSIFSNQIRVIHLLMLPKKMVGENCHDEFLLVSIDIWAKRSLFFEYRECVCESKRNLKADKTDFLLRNQTDKLEPEYVVDSHCTR